MLQRTSIRCQSPVTLRQYVSVYCSLHCTFQSAEKTHCLSERCIQTSQPPSTTKRWRPSSLLGQINFNKAILTYKKKKRDGLNACKSPFQVMAREKHSFWESPALLCHDRLLPSTMGLAAAELGFPLLDDKPRRAGDVSLPSSRDPSSSTASGHYHNVCHPIAVKHQH